MLDYSLLLTHVLDCNSEECYMLATKRHSCGVTSLFEILGMKSEFIPLSKSKRTLKYYNQWWNTVFGLIKDDIYKTINK